MVPPLPRIETTEMPATGSASLSDADPSTDADHDPFAGFAPALDAVREIAGAYLAGLPERPVSRAATLAEMERALDGPLPETGTDPAAALREWFERAEAGIVASPGPRFFGFVNGGSFPAALAGDWLASALDQNLVAWASSPAGAQTETVVIRWLLDLFGLPPGWGGTLTTGATMANLVGLAAARQWAGERMGFDPAADGLSGNPRIPVLVSEVTHASVRKALATLGLGRTATIEIPAPGGVMDPVGVRDALARLDGPAIVVAGLGEVNTGETDDLTAIADARDDHPHGVWLHVDGAFGLFAALSPRTAGLVAGVERADSVATDGHKWLNVSSHTQPHRRPRAASWSSPNVAMVPRPRSWLLRERLGPRRLAP